MPLATTYTTGTASVTNGTTAVTGTGTEWLRTVRVGDFFGTHEGLPIRIASIEDDEALTLAYNWPGTTLTDDPYEILYADDASRATAQTRELIERMRALDVNTMGLFYEFSTATADVDPGVGAMALNSGTLASVTEAYFDNIDANTTGRDVTGLLGLWDVGTTLLIRSIESTAYAAYTMTGPVSDETGYRKAASLTYVGSSGSFVDGEAIAVSWFGVGEGLQIDALGAFADRDDYDAEAEGFIYLSTNGDGSTGVSTIYRKNSAVSGDWSDGALFQGAAGNTGWSPKFGIATDGSRRVLQLLAYVGGTGTAPTGDINKYVSASGYTSTIGDAIDIRGSIGLTGDDGVQGDDGPAGWAPYFGIVTDGDRRVLQLAGYVGGGGTEPTDNVGDYVSVGGYTPTIASAADIRGDIGLTGDTGADGTGPGVFFVWDADNADSDQGGGKIWANDDDLAVAVTVYVSKTNRGTDDVSTYLATFDDSTSTTSKGTLILTADDATSQAIFDVTTLTDASNYVKLTVVHQGGVTAFAANDIINLQFYARGDRGEDGDGAFTGPGSAVPDNFLSFDGPGGNLGKDSGFGPDDFAYVGNNLDDLDDANVALDNLHVQGADIASASTVDLEAATGYFVDVTGTTTTTAVTLADGHERWVRAAGAWPITVGASLVLNNGGSNYTCSAGDMIHFIADGTVIRGTVFRIDGQPMTTIGLTKGGTGQTTAYAGLDALTVKGSNVASATTTDIGAATGEFIHITGTTTITGFGTKTAGVIRALVFDGALTLTHNATSLILPGGANITTAAGDTAIMVSEGSGNWKCIQYTRASGKAVVAEVTLAGSETLTNKTLTQPIITLEQGASVAPTAEGRIAWDTDDNKLKVGDGAATKTYTDDERREAATITALKALNGASLTDGQLIYLRGGSSIGDGKEGFVIYRSSLSTTGDDVVFFEPADSTGRFIRKEWQDNTEIFARWWGLTLNSTAGRSANGTALTALAAFISASSKAGRCYFPQGIIYVSSATTVFDFSKTRGWRFFGTAPSGVSLGSGTRFYISGSMGWFIKYRSVLQFTWEDCLFLVEDDLFGVVDSGAENYYDTDGTTILDGAALSSELNTFRNCHFTSGPGAVTAFTVTIASPGVFTSVGHGLAADDRIRLSTTGTLPTGLSVSTDYYVLATGLTVDAFRLSLTSGGAAINTSGAQSGTHSYTQRFQPSIAHLHLHSTVSCRLENCWLSSANVALRLGSAGAIAGDQDFRCLAKGSTGQIVIESCLIDGDIHVRKLDGLVMRGGQMTRQSGVGASAACARFVASSLELCQAITIQGTLLGFVGDFSQPFFEMVANGLTIDPGCVVSGYSYVAKADGASKNWNISPTLHPSSGALTSMAAVLRIASTCTGKNLRSETAFDSRLTSGRVIDDLRAIKDFVAGVICGSKTFDYSSIVNGSFQRTTVNVTGAVSGLPCWASLTTVQAGIYLSAECYTDDVIEVIARNSSGVTLDLASGTLAAYQLVVTAP